jgi:hypothetical protein
MEMNRSTHPFSESFENECLVMLIEPDSVRLMVDVLID